jgi:hypothetical protein
MDIVGRKTTESINARYHVATPGYFEAWAFRSSRGG